MSKEAPKKVSQPRLVVLSKASKLAEKWVNEMIGSFQYSKSTEVEIEGRPERLGIGAAVPRNAKYALSTDPVERKLRPKIEAEKRKNLENSAPTAADEENLEKAKPNHFPKKDLLFRAHFRKQRRVKNSKALRGQH